MAVSFVKSSDYFKLCEQVVSEALESLELPCPDPSDKHEIGVVFADLKNPTVQIGDICGAKQMYTASVVKLFHLVYAVHLLQNQKIEISIELERAIRDMIVDSSNDATALVVDTITGTTGGPMLPDKEFRTWIEKRIAITQFFNERGFPDLLVHQKTWNEAPYGRESQARGLDGEFRNRISALDAAKLMVLIARDEVIEPGLRGGQDWSTWMKSFLKRDIGPNSGEQSKDFIGGILKPADILYSKAGWTDEVRHDVAWIKTENQEFVLSILTKGYSNDFSLIPTIAKGLLDRASK